MDVGCAPPDIKFFFLMSFAERYSCLLLFMGFYPGRLEVVVFIGCEFGLQVSGGVTPVEEVLVLEGRPEGG